MSTLKVNNIESFTGASPVTINDQLITSGSTASGVGAVAFGSQTSATGPRSYAEGFNTTAEGNSSHAEGSTTTATGNYSHAEGQGTIASASYQHVQGKYNVADGDTNTLMIIGNGMNQWNRSNLVKFTLEGVIFDKDAIPSSSNGLVTGQLYRTGSGLDEIKIKL